MLSMLNGTLGLCSAFGRNGWKSMGGVGRVGDVSGEDGGIAVVGVVQIEATGEEEG